MASKGYQDLVVWQKSMDLVTEVYKLAKMLPKEETYALSDQMRRAAVSIPSNIAEGQARNHIKEFINFLSIAKGSLAELETQLLISVKLNYLPNAQVELVLQLASEVAKMLNALMSKLTTSN